MTMKIKHNKAHVLYKALGYDHCNHLLCVAGEHCRGKLDAKEKAAFSFKYLLVYSFRVKSIEDALYPSGQPTSFSCSLQILDEKCVEFSSELNGTLLRFLR